MATTRRELIELSALAAFADVNPKNLESLGDASLQSGLRESAGDSPLKGGRWYEAPEPGALMVYRFPAGRLAGLDSLTADFLLDGNTSQIFTLELFEGEQGRRFHLTFSGLNQCSFRLRMALALVDQNRWQADREGAFLKPMVGGDRIDLKLVDRAALKLLRKAEGTARFCTTPLLAARQPVERMQTLILPKGPLVDEMGQSRLRDWPGRTKSVDELTSRLRSQHQSAATQSWPQSFTSWGGWKSRKLTDGSGFFGVKKDGARWWLTDPDGYAFWSSGADCVRVDCQARVDGIESALTWRPPDEPQPNEGARPNAKFVNYLAANFVRAFGREGWRERWAATALGEMKRLRFNTVGNWSEWHYAAKARFPYVRPLESRRGAASVPRIYRDFPDVFHPEYPSEAAVQAASLKETASDPALIGYFLMNEPTWGFSSELPAAGMLYTSESCATRDELVRFLKTTYSGDAALAAAWKMPVSLDRVGRGRWSDRLTPEALADLRKFSVRMVEHYFKTLSAACRKADPKHLNLGMRWAGIPPEWAVEGMKTFDVYSLNCYMEKLPLERATKIHEMLGMPVMVGEWHFGALDVGLPASGIGHVRTQADRGRAYRVYLEDAAADPYCVGVHWFTLYDQSALGRFDGENYNIGFLDICNRPYAELAGAAITSHERMYEVAAGQTPPFTGAPEYLPKLFL